MFFDKAKVKANFNQANQSYNANAVLQKIVARNLVAWAKDDIFNAQNIIDLGCGTGFVAKQILDNFSDKKIFQIDIAEQMLKVNPLPENKIVADIELLPIKRNVFDLGLSSLSFQWLNDLERSLGKIIELIKSEGSFYFSLIAEGSLQELKISSKQCNVDLSINQFISQEKLQQILQNLNLSFQIHSEKIILQYQDCYELLKSIKSIGAGYSKNQKYISKKQFNLLANFYLKNFNLQNKVSATWQVLFVSIKPNQQNV